MKIKEPYRKILTSTLNFALILVLFSFSFTGSLVSIASIELAEADAAYNAELEMIRKDSSRIDPVRVTMKVKGENVPRDIANRALADQHNKKEKIRYFLNIVPFIRSIDFLRLPDRVILVISSTFLGLLGALIMLIKESTYDSLVLTPDLILKRAALGFSSGLLVVALSYVLPSIIMLDADVEIKIETLTAFSLITGLYFKTLLEKISKRVKQ